MEVPTMQNKLSSAQLRKIKKPIIERRRRERINDSMNQLKSLLLEALNKDVPSHSKMEKADILELAVDYLTKVKTSVSKPTPREAATKYQSGYKQCAQEVSRYLSMRGEGTELASRVKCHLSEAAAERSSVRDSCRIPEATSYSSLPGAVPVSLPVPVRVLRADPATTVVPLYHGHIPQSYAQMSRSHSGVVTVASTQDSIQTPSPRATSEAFRAPIGGLAKCGLEIQTRLPGLCEDYSLAHGHSDAPLWRPW